METVGRDRMNEPWVVQVNVIRLLAIHRVAKQVSDVDFVDFFFEILLTVHFYFTKYFHRILKSKN